MIRSLYLRVQDFFEYDVRDFLSRANVIGRMRDAEAEAGCLAFQNFLLDATLRYGAQQHNYAVGALREIHVACAAVATPNGTTRKVGRMAGEALNALRNGVDDAVQGEFTEVEQQVGA